MTVSTHVGPIPGVVPVSSGFCSVSYDGRLIHWRLQDDRLAASETKSLHRKGINCVAASGEMVATGGSDSVAQLVDLRTMASRRLEHPGDVESLQFSEDGALLATGGTNREMRLWSVADGRLLKVSEHGGTVGAMCLHEGLLVTGSNDGRVRFFDRTGALVRQFRPLPSPVKSLASTTRGLLVGAHDACVYLLDATVGDFQRVRQFTSTPKAMTVSPDRRTAWIAVYDNRIYRLDLEQEPWTSEEVVFEPRLWNHGIGVTETHLIAGSFDGAPFVWRIGAEGLEPVSGLDAPVPCLSAACQLGPNGPLVGGGDSGELRRLDTGEVLFRAHGAITSLTRIEDDLLIGTWAGEVLRLTQTESGWSVRWRSSFDAGCPVLRADTNGSEVVVGLYTGGAMGLDANTGLLRWRQMEATGAVKSVAVHGALAAVTGRYDPLRLLRVSDGTVIVRAELKTSVSDVVAFSPFSGARPRLAVCAENNEIWFFEASARGELERIGRSDGNACAVKALLWMGPDEVIAGDYEGCIRRHRVGGSSELLARIPCRLGISSLTHVDEGLVWTSFDGSRGTLQLPLGGVRLPKPVETRSFSRLRPDRGHRGYVRAAGLVRGTHPGVVSLGYDGTLRKYEENTLRPLLAVHAHDRSGGTLSVAPDGVRVATGGADRFVRIWDAGGDDLVLLSEHPLPVLDENPIVETVCWSPDGSTLIVGGVGGSLWELLPSGELRLIDREGLLSINALAFSPDGRFLYVASDECTVRVYEHTADGFVCRRKSEEFDDHVDGLAVRLLPDGRHELAAVTHGNRIWMLSGVPEDLTTRSAPVAEHALNAVTVVGSMLLAAGDDHLVFAISPETLEADAIVDVWRDVDHLAAVDADRVLVSTTGGLCLVSQSMQSVIDQQQNVGALAAIVVQDGLLFAGHHDEPRLTIGRWEGASGQTIRTVELFARVSCAAPTSADFGLANGELIHVRSDGSVERLARATAEVEAILRVGDCVIGVDRNGCATFTSPRGTFVRRVTPDGSRLKALALMELDGRRFLLTAGKNQRLYGLSPPDEAGTLPESWEVHGSNIAVRTFNSLATGANGQVFLGCWDNRIHRLTLESPMRVARVAPPLEGHDHAVETLCLSGGRLVSVSYDGTCRIWNLDGAIPASTSLPLSELAIRRIFAVAGTSRVVTAGYDGVVSEIDVERSVPIRTWEVA